MFLGLPSPTIGNVHDKNDHWSHFSIFFNISILFWPPNSSLILKKDKYINKKNAIKLNAALKNSKIKLGKFLLIIKKA